MKDQELRLLAYLKSDSLEEAKNAYAFIQGNTAGTNTPSEKDGIYLIYEDGHHDLYTVDNLDIDKVRYIGIIDGAQRIAVSTAFLGEHPLPTKEGFKDNYPYKRGSIPAAYDFNGRDNTKHLLEQGDFNFKLEDGEWLPSAGELALIYRHKGEVNDALNYMEATHSMRNGCGAARRTLPLTRGT